MSRAALVVCPGRGSYTASELGYLDRPVPTATRERLSRAIERIDGMRAGRGEPTIREIDGASKFKKSYFAGSNAAAVTFACTALDFLRLDRTAIDIVGVTGNSMGWYSALFAGGALSLDETFDLVDTMGAITSARGRGGQMIYPLVDDEWRRDEARRTAVEAALTDVTAAGFEAGHSILYGGFAVLWAEDRGLKKLAKRLPATKLGTTKYPLLLPGHAAFHSPLMQDAADEGAERLTSMRWSAPGRPMIDGRGCQWRPLGGDPTDLAVYTLRTQVLRTFDFSVAIRVALREYAPEVIVLLGPGDTLGGAVAQVVIAEGWQGIDSRQAFLDRQADDPILISLGRADQAQRVVAAHD